MNAPVHPLRSYLTSRRVVASAAVLLGACVGVAMLSTSDTGILSLVATGVTPLARLVTVLIGIAIAAPLTPGFEADYMSPLRRDVLLWHIAVAFMTSAGTGAVLAALLSEPNMWALPRLVTFWTALAIISTTVCGSPLGGLLPTTTAVGIALFGQPDATSNWNIVMSTEDAPVLWIMLALVTAQGTRCAVR